MRLRVLKADGSIEDYLHTKVIGTINNVLGRTGQSDVATAQELAEVVTYYIHQQANKGIITSGEILSVIKTGLFSTGYHQAAEILEEHSYTRKLKRDRIEVVSIDIEQLSDAHSLCNEDFAVEKNRWNKTRIVEWLTEKHKVDRTAARLIAAMVEEKVLSMGVRVVSRSLVKQLVLADTAAVLKAEKRLQQV